MKQKISQIGKIMSSLSIIQLALVSLLFGTGCASVVHTVGVITGDEEMQKADLKMTPQRQYFLGRSFAANVLQESPLIKDKAVLDYVASVGQYLAIHADPSEGAPGPFKGFHFGVFKSDTPMAMSSPGGFVLLSTAMIEMLDNEDQLAAVLGHEMGHVMWEHGVKEIEKKARNAGVMKLGLGLLSAAGGQDAQNVAKVLAVFGEALTDMVNKSFSKEDEFQADRYGYYLTRKAGYDSAQLLEVIAKVSLGKSGDKAGNVFSRHPAGESRVAEIKSLQKRRPASALSQKRVQRYQDFKKLVAKAAAK